jgi:hypothetical protein
MKKFIALFCIAATSALSASYVPFMDITDQIPQIESAATSKFKRIPDVAQYKMADWSNAIGIARGITLDEAYKIAEENPKITFFFHMKAWRMVLEREDGTCRIFYRGDAVFFSGEPWWGSAPGFSDGYIKKQPA